MINKVNFYTGKYIYPVRTNSKRNNVVSFSSKNNFYMEKIEYMPPEVAYEYLSKVTSNQETADEFIKEITQNPRESKKNVRKLVWALGSKDNFTKWYFQKDGYMQAFHKFLGNFWYKAGSIEELVKYMPSWGDWKLAEKSKLLSGSEHYTLGKLPVEFKNKKTFQELANLIKTSYWTGKRVEGDVTVNGQDFNIKYPSGGLSGKAVAIINDKYVLKTSFSKKYKADSPYLNGVVDYYLTSNNCINACKLLFYDEKSNTVLYRKMNLGKCKLDEGDSGILYSPMTLYNGFSDAKSLGVIFTDVGKSNYVNDGENDITIDSGHAEYMDILKPGMAGFNITLPSNTGFSQMAYNGVLNEIYN